MTTELEFFYDFSSPNAYFSHVQLEDFLPDSPVEVVYRPVFLGGILKQLQTSPPVENNELKAKYLWVDINRWADKYDIPYRDPSTFPINSLYALRALLVLEDQKPDRVDPFVDRVFAAYWAEDRDIANRNVLGNLLEDAGAEPDPVLSEIGDETVKRELRDRTDRALERGVFGVPTFIVGDELFWGKDRMEFVRDALEQ